ncbi:DsbA family oxidoreductase [Pleurocapsa sp. FMAR1]|uniref:DsbA family oxidoreductase n=1 Tax=Pleurocapsa sp. FMAR1 TaxID=3040204 RepID=UPI0029C6E4B4|nr:DsbA family oxidoreductase [Pleurocapsa sp. FMAR1]
MSIKIKVYSDYVCPYCFLAKQTLDKVAKEQEVEIEWMPFELRPYPTPTLKPEDDYLPRVWQQSVYPLAEAMEISIQLPSISPQPYTHSAFEGYQFAKAHGKAEAYNDRVLKAFFQEDRDIGELEVLVQLAEEIGLPKQEFKQALIERRYKAIHQQALKHAYESVGVTSVPTLVIGGQIFLGIPRKENLQQAIKTAKAN